MKNSYEEKKLISIEENQNNDVSIIDLFQNLEVFPNESLKIERLEWIKNVQLEKEEWLGAVHIYYFFLLLEAQFGKEFNGFSILSEASYKFSKKTRKETLSNVLQNSLHVVHLENHWVAISNVDCAKNHWKLYDSLDYSIDLLKAPLKILNNDSHAVFLQKQAVQKQNNDFDCGLFALAYLTNICFGKDPLDYEFVQDKMRDHYLQCAKKGKATIFPGSNVPRRKNKNEYISLN